MVLNHLARDLSSLYNSQTVSHFFFHATLSLTISIHSRLGTLSRRRSQSTRQPSRANYTLVALITHNCSPAPTECNPSSATFDLTFSFLKKFTLELIRSIVCPVLQGCIDHPSNKIMAKYFKSVKCVGSLDWIAIITLLFLSSVSRLFVLGDASRGSVTQRQMQRSRSHRSKKVVETLDGTNV